MQDCFANGDRVPNSFLSEHSVQYPYAYHFDAGLLAEYLEGYAMQRGVTKVEDEVIHVALREDGSISHCNQGARRDRRRPVRRLHRLPRPADQPSAR